MYKKSGRPLKNSADYIDSRQKIIDAALTIIKNYGADSVTVRRVCETSGLSTGTFYHYFSDKDDLMMNFLREPSFDEIELKTPIENIGGRISELYMRLIKKYMEFGENFMKSFYTTSNRSLSAYMGEKDGKFAAGTVMARCEDELITALNKGVIKKNSDVHLMSQDICTIIKGCVFEWCLSDGKTDIELIIRRIINNYMYNYLA